MKNWIKFFRKTDVGEDQSLKFYNYISSFSDNIKLSIKEISSHCDLSILERKKIIAAAISSQIIRPLNQCPHCQHNFLNNIDDITNIDEIAKCETCNEEFNFFDEDLFGITKFVSKNSEAIKKLEEESYETNAELLSQIGTRQQFLYYLLTDIVSSEKLQKKDNKIYASYLKFLWDEFWPTHFKRCKKIYLPLMAKGDAVTIVFSELSDLLSIVENMRDGIEKIENLRLSATASKITFQSKDRSGFVRSLDKKWDLNTSDVTRTFRGSEKIKPKKWGIDKSYKIKFLALDELAEILHDYPSPYSKMEYGTTNYEDKHKQSHTRRYLGGVF